ncbi:protein c-ets-2-A [Caerostris darwini]|uniref:Protein c-ets-2-A n=1 Tax=Caerostris darwini TaxID=1538125 RepID=A0AAV4SHR7_9ARAC|nr:protein c-ets-2-A [Caerostris darwini]
MNFVKCPLRAIYITSILILIDPRTWSEEDVIRWLYWAIREFSLENVNTELFRMKGKDMCSLDKEVFLSMVPHFVGEILWEHLETLLRDSRTDANLELLSSNSYEGIPEIDEFFPQDYCYAPLRDQKVTPVMNGVNATTPIPGSQPPYLDGKYPYDFFVSRFFSHYVVIPKSGEDVDRTILDAGSLEQK